jgi:hypothetical protein
MSSGMLRRVVLVRTDVSEELSASETSVLIRATRRNIPEYTILIVTAVKTSNLTSTLLHSDQIWNIRMQEKTDACAVS